MHDYSIDRHPKEVVLFILAFIAISSAPALNRWIADLVDYLDAATGWKSGPVTAIPVFGLFTAIYYLFNTRLWKLSWPRRLLLVPDLNGTWQCEGLTVLRRGIEESTPWSGEITITQSWSKMLIHLRTAQSASHSVSASLAHEPGIGYRLLYHYRNDPNAENLELQKHDGAAEMLFSQDCQTGTGNYFTDQHRRTIGTMKIKKVEHGD